ncbi:MAG: Ribosome-recycling factor [Parcubacteria group bacterium GW2011_GWB1_45_9]|nr:MAG: Ribosome-recycling factor [Parcubacteria group bacterium GW2011_GWB1_45_9]
MVDDLSKIVESLRNELIGTRGNRPSPKMIENIPVDAYGQKMTVKQLGSITIVPPREIDITVWDKEAVNFVAKAVEASPLGVTANVEGNLIRLNLPTLTEERKKEIIKMVKSTAEEHRIKIRAARDEANKKIKDDERDKKINEDESFKLKEKVQKSVNDANKKIEEVVLAKIKEIEE